MSENVTLQKCKRSLPDDLQCDLQDGHKGACKGTQKRCLCYYAINDFDGVNHDPRCKHSAPSPSQPTPAVPAPSRTEEEIAQHFSNRYAGETRPARLYEIYLAAIQEALAAQAERENRWEVGIRNIVHRLHGPRHEFEIADIVNEVSAQAERVRELERQLVSHGGYKAVSEIADQRAESAERKVRLAVETLSLWSAKYYIPTQSEFANNVTISSSALAALLRQLQEQEKL